MQAAISFGYSMDLISPVNVHQTLLGWFKWGFWNFLGLYVAVIVLIVLSLFNKDLSIKAGALLSFYSVG